MRFFFQSYRRLVFVTTSLLSFVDSGRSLEAIIVSNHFGDILAALLMVRTLEIEKFNTERTDLIGRMLMQLVR